MMNLCPDLCLRQKTVVLCRRRGWTVPPLQPHKTEGSRNVHLVCAVPGFANSEGMPVVSNTRHVCCFTQQTFCCVTHQTRLLCRTADIVCYEKQETLSAVSHSRHVGCVTQQTCVLCHVAASSQKRTCCLFGLLRTAEDSDLRDRGRIEGEQSLDLRVVVFVEICGDIFRLGMALTDSNGVIAKRW